MIAPAVLTGFRTGDGLPGWLRWPGLALTVLGVALVADSFARLLHARGLARGGSFELVRHPMYLGGTVALAGEALLLRQPVLLLGALAYTVTLGLLAARSEEPLLARRFGPAWDAYAAEVPRFVPRSSAFAASRSPKPPLRK